MIELLSRIVHSDFAAKALNFLDSRMVAYGYAQLAVGALFVLIGGILAAVVAKCIEGNNVAARTRYGTGEADKRAELEAIESRYTAVGVVSFFIGAPVLFFGFAAIYKSLPLICGGVVHLLLQ